ncbi:MAG: F0F1 ATP synthase subunit gamma [Candidatus Omnitrophota bacterium]|jgi:ATP synthase F1 gamma subunit
MKLISQIKSDLEFNRNLASLIGVLKEIAIFQFHVMEKKIRSFDKIFILLQRLFEMAMVRHVAHPLLNPSRRTPGVIAITSDSGLLGAMNMQVISVALREVEDNQAKLIIVGEKGRMYARENNASFVGFTGIKDDNRLSLAMQLRDYIINEELNQKLGGLKIVYPYAASLMNQRIQIEQLLPYTGDKKEKLAITQEIIMESSAGEIAGYLVYLLLGQKFYEIFGFSRLAEMAARYVHLEDSEDKLEKMEQELRLQYFRQRHELIDRNMRELFAARLTFR